MRILVLVVVVLVALGAGRPVGAQQADSTPSPVLPARLQATRAALEQLLARLAVAERASDSSDDARAAARLEAAGVRVRLADGDFQPGDRVLLLVEGGEATTERSSAAGGARSVEQQLSDTFTVGPARRLTLPVIGVISLHGVLRSELDGHLTGQIGQFIKDPVVHARPLIRVSVLGAVARPGFYSVPADAVLSDAVMAAGGPTADAKMQKLRIVRAGNELWGGERLQLALTEGKSLDDLNLRAGDQLILPGKARSGTYETVRTLGIVLSIPITVYTLTQIFKK
ncbi:MAG TPA: SLBB domain-containing protein [Gemmatimonadales bacterium]|nr:SLBB domain-containing protein [Gemmatimonadales bacterium]